MFVRGFVKFVILYFLLWVLRVHALPHPKNKGSVHAWILCSSLKTAWNSSKLRSQTHAWALHAHERQKHHRMHQSRHVAISKCMEFVKVAIRNVCMSASHLWTRYLWTELFTVMYCGFILDICVHRLIVPCQQIGKKIATFDKKFNW